jgi:tetratricopeptide (TPR) repeat protein
MKRYLKMMNRILFVGILLPCISFAQTHRAYADELFKKADYYKAFFLYRNLYGTNLEENQFAQRCNQAMKLTKEFLDLRATQQYYDAKTKLRELLEINPDDFHAPILPQMSIEEATYWHRLALKQNSAKEVNLMLEKAVALYKQGKTDGWKYKEIDDAIKQCEASRMDSGLAESSPESVVATIPKVEIIHATPIEQAVASIKTEEIPTTKVEETEKLIQPKIKITKTKNRKSQPRREVATRQ